MPHVLVADSDGTSLQHTVSLLEHARYQVSRASDGKAMPTIDASRMTRNCAVHSRKSADQRRGSGIEIEGVMGETTQRSRGRSLLPQELEMGDPSMNDH